MAVLSTYREREKHGEKDRERRRERETGRGRGDPQSDKRQKATVGKEADRGKTKTGRAGEHKGRRTSRRTFVAPRSLDLRSTWWEYDTYSVVHRGIIARGPFFFAAILSSSLTSG